MNVFDVGVTIHLVDKVSAGLAQVAMGFARTQSAATALQTTMNTIHSKFASGAMMIAGGAALAAPLIAATHAGEKYIHQLNVMKTSGLQQKEMADSIAAAWKITGSVLNSTATDNLKAYMDLRSVFNDHHESLEFMPKLIKMRAAYTGLLDGKMSGKGEEKMVFSAAKALDMSGKANNKKDFDSALENIFRVGIATGGHVTAQDYMTTFKYMRQSKWNLDDNFLYKVLPEFMLENKGGNSGSGGVGPQIAALYRFGVQGIMNKRSGQLLVDMDLVRPENILKTTSTGTTLKGGLLGATKGADVLARNPFEWTDKILVPALAKQFKVSETNNAALTMASNELFKGNQLAANLVAEMINKRTIIPRFGQLLDKTDTIEQSYARSLANDPRTAWQALDMSFEILQTSIGEHVIPFIVPKIIELSKAIGTAARYLHDHPGTAKMLASVVAFASSALILGGSLRILHAGFLGLKLLFGPFGFVLSKLAGPIGGLIGARGLSGLGVAAFSALRVIGPLGIAITAVSLIVLKWDKIMEFVHKHADFFIVVAARVCGAMEQLGMFAMKLAGWLVSAVGAIAGALGNIPVLGPWLKDVAAVSKQAFDSVTKVSAMDAYAGEKYFRDRGMKGFIDFARGNVEYGPNRASAYDKGIAGLVNNAGAVTPQRAKELMMLSEAAKGKPNWGLVKATSPHQVQVGKVEQHFHIPNADPKKVADEVMRRGMKGIKQAGAASGGSGSVATSRHAHGAGK